MIGDTMKFSFGKKKNPTIVKNDEFIRTGKLEDGRNILDGYDEFKKELDRKENARKRSKLMAKVLSYVIVFGGIAFAIYFSYKEFLAPYTADSRLDKSAKSYINDIYYSDEYFYNTYLNDTEKKIYDEWVKSLKEKTQSIFIDMTIPDNQQSAYNNSIEKVYRVIRLDHPEIFYLSNYSSSIVQTGITLTNVFTTEDYYLPIEERRILRKIDRMAKKWSNLTVIEKEKAVYEWFGKNVKHVEETDILSNHGVYGALFNGEATSEGISYATQILFQKLGVPSRIAIGRLDSDHYWNIVTLNEKYYYFDASVASEVQDLTSPSFYKGLNITDRSKYSLFVYTINDDELGNQFLN